jgi:hypothetical protein
MIQKVLDSIYRKKNFSNIRHQGYSNDRCEFYIGNLWNLYPQITQNFELGLTTLHPHIGQ